MLDLLNDIRDKLYGLGDSVRSMLPYSVRDKLVYAVPIAAAGVSAVAIGLCLSANMDAASIDAQAQAYRAGQEQLSSVLGDAAEAGFDSEAETVMGRTDLMLQYIDLSTLDGENVFENMEKMANVSQDAEDQAAEEADSEWYGSIIEYAGDYGGALLLDPDGDGKEIYLAAYEDEEDMEEPEISGVSNVLVKQLRRTIESDTYGEKDTTNTLTILSGTDITNFSSIQEGYAMYLLIGPSSGSKQSNRYVCTGIEPGTLEGSVAADEDEEETDGTDEAEEGEDISLSASAGASFLRLSSSSSRVSTDSDGTITYSDGTKVESDGTVIYSDGTIVEPDGTVIYPDGMTISPDGTISGASVQESGSSGSGSSSSSGSEDGTDDEDEEENSAEADEEDEEEDLADAELPDVLSGSGSSLEDDKEHDLILYSINSRTGSVTITYWELDD